MAISPKESIRFGAELEDKCKAVFDKVDIDAKSIK